MLQMWAARLIQSPRRCGLQAKSDAGKNGETATRGAKGEARCMRKAYVHYQQIVQFDAIVIVTRCLLHDAISVAQGAS